MALNFVETREFAECYLFADILQSLHELLFSLYQAKLTVVLSLLPSFSQYAGVLYSFRACCSTQSHIQSFGFPARLDSFPYDHLLFHILNMSLHVLYTKVNRDILAHLSLHQFLHSSHECNGSNLQSQA